MGKFKNENSTMKYMTGIIDFIETLGFYKLCSTVWFRIHKTVTDNLTIYTMRKLIYFNSILLVLLSFSIQLFAQFKNENEYLKLNDKLFCQYSPLEQGWIIFKYDDNSKTYLKQEYSESTNNKKSVFENIYVVSNSEFYTYYDKSYKRISYYNSEINSSKYKELLIYNSPHTDRIFTFAVRKNMEDKYDYEQTCCCDTFIIQNGTFIPIFYKDNPNISEDIFTQNNLVVPHLFDYIKYLYSIKKNSEGFILSDKAITTNIGGPLINSYSEAYRPERKELTRQFPVGINLSYYNADNFLLSEKDKWYICKTPQNNPLEDANLTAYFADANRILPKDKTLYSYFGDLEASSIKVLTWDSGKPAYFIANINGVHSLYDYRKAVIKNVNKDISFPINEGIWGDYIRAYCQTDYVVGKVQSFDPLYLEVKQGNTLTFYKYDNDDFVKIETNPFKGNFKAIFKGSTYKEYNNTGQIISEQTFKPTLTTEEIAEEIKRQAEEEEFLRQEKLKIQSEGLKSAINQSKLKFCFDYGEDYNQFNPNGYFYDFPVKYYNGSQPFLNDRTGFGVGGGYKFNLSIVDNGVIKEVDVDNSEDVIAIGSSNRNEKFYYYGEFNIANINSGYFNQVGFAKNSYDTKYYLITKKFSLSNTSASFLSSQIIPFTQIFPENPDINKDDIEIIWHSRLSNNSIIILLKTNIEYLSNQLNSMFGVNGMNKISRTFQTASYYKFIVLSEDGSKLYANKNYLVPIKFIRPIDNGFIILSEKLGNVISLNNADFGRKSTVYSQSTGKNIIVTEGINFSSNTSYKNGIRIFKFDNNAELIKEITVDNPTDDRIKKPIPIYIQHSENYLCLQYQSYEKGIINEKIYAYNLYDFDLNLISSIVDNNTGILTSLNDEFYLNTSNGRHDFSDFKMYKTSISFKNNR